MAAESPRNPARDTGYHARYVRLGAARRRFTSFDPLGPGLAAGDGAPGGMTDHSHAAGRPSRREQEIAAWLTADVPDELLGAQFDIATLLAKVEQLRDSAWMSTRNMIEAERRANAAEGEGACRDLASRYAVLKLSVEVLERQNAVLRAAATCNCGRPDGEAAEAERGTGRPAATPQGAGQPHGLLPDGSGAHPAGGQYGPADMTVYDRHRSSVL